MDDHGNGQFGAAGVIGQILSVRGSEAHISLPAPWPDQQARATVGKFVAISAGDKSVIGMITEVSASRTDDAAGQHRARARISLMGEIVAEHGPAMFRRGVSEYPAIGDDARLVSGEQ